MRELTSLETGVLGLNTGETVLFHLDQVTEISLLFSQLSLIKVIALFEQVKFMSYSLQVWTHTAEKVPYKTVQDSLLETYLPLGSSVWVNYRTIASGQSSSLKYQATIVFKNVEGSDDRIPKEYIDKFKPFEIRVALVRFSIPLFHFNLLIEFI